LLSPFISNCSALAKRCEVYFASAEKPCDKARDELLDMLRKVKKYAPWKMYKLAKYNITHFDGCLSEHAGTVQQLAQGVLEDVRLQCHECGDLSLYMRNRKDSKRPGAKSYSFCSQECSSINWNRTRQQRR
jgi:hypothetical protein